MDLFFILFSEDEAPAKPATPMVNGKVKKDAPATPISAKKAGKKAVTIAPVSSFLICILFYFIYIHTFFICHI